MDVPTARRLFEEHHAVLHSFLRRMTGDPALAEDLTQDVFVRVVRGLDGYEDRGRERAWLFRIARRLLLDRSRNESRRPRLVPEEEAAELGIREEPPSLDLERALLGLGPGERECFLLREIGGLGYGEIAALTGATPDAVRSRIHRARMSLRSALSRSRPSGRDGLEIVS